MRELVWAIVVLLGLLFALCLTGSVHAQISPRVLPPPEYDYEYEGDLTIKVVDTLQELGVLCQDAARTNPDILACSMRNYKSCMIIMVRDEVMRRRGYSTGIMLRHERGHCNGWGGDHTGGRPARATMVAPEYERIALPQEWLAGAQRLRP